jgi:hypothetical protein
LGSKRIKGRKPRSKLTPGKIGVGRSNFKFGVPSFPNESINSHAKFEICTPDPNAATPVLLAAQKDHQILFTLLLSSNVVELGSGDQISHLASGGIGLIERTVWQDVSASIESPSAKSEV